MRAILTSVCAFGLAVFSTSAFAQVAPAVPEPGVLELAGLALAVAFALKFPRNRR